MNTSFKIIDSLGLNDYLKILIENNKSNRLAYHNFFHIMCVTKNTFVLAYSEKLSTEDKKRLAIASLFHDFDHSGGSLPDDKNVEIAINEFLKYSKETPEENDIIVSIIKATQYPYVIAEQDLTILQKIIRDADLMQTFEANYLQQNVMGLCTEMSVNKPEPMTFLQGLEGSKTFWSAVKFHTPFAQEMAKKIMPEKFEDVEFLIKLLK